MVCLTSTQRLFMVGLLSHEQCSCGISSPDNQSIFWPSLPSVPSSVFLWRSSVACLISLSVDRSITTMKQAFPQLWSRDKNGTVSPAEAITKVLNVSSAICNIRSKSIPLPSFNLHRFNWHLQSESIPLASFNKNRFHFHHSIKINCKWDTIC